MATMSARTCTRTCRWSAPATDALDDLAAAALLFRSRLHGLLLAEAERRGADDGPDRLAGRPPLLEPCQAAGAEALGGGALLLAQPKPPATQEWRLYGRALGDMLAPFSLDGVLPAEAAPEAMVRDAFRLILQREPDPEALRFHRDALRAGESASTMLRGLLGSPEAMERGEQLFLVLAAAPPA